MRSEEDSIEFHHGLVDSTDYQVDEVLLCVEARDDLKRGALCVTHEVTRRKVGNDVVTIVKVEKDGHIIEVPNAEFYLARTQLWVDFRMRNGRLVRHSFPSIESFGAWCAAFCVPPEAIHQMRYVRARPIPRIARFAAMCVPGETPEESEWYVHDLAYRTSERVPLGVDSRPVAIALARESNRAWQEVLNDDQE